MTFHKEIGELVEISRVGVEELSVDWRIREVFSVLCGNGNWFLSPAFRMGFTFWRFGLCPNWTDEAQNLTSGRLWLNLGRIDGGLPKPYRYSVGIRGSEGVENIIDGEWVYSGYRSCPWIDFCQISELMELRTRLVPDGVLTIVCAIDTPGAARRSAREVDVLQKTVLKRGGEKCVAKRAKLNVLKKRDDNKATLKEQGTEELKESLKNLLVSGKDNDVVIRVQTKEFPVHRLILQMRSPVFEAMFSHDMVEKLSGIVTVEDCDQETFPDFLEHVYTGNVEMISNGNVFSLYTASDKYDLKTLKNACAEFLKNNVTISSFCDIFTLAIKYDEKELIEIATEFFCKNLVKICKTDEWQIFLKENTSVGNELIVKAFSK